MLRVLRLFAVLSLITTALLSAKNELPFKLNFELETKHPIRIVDPADNGYLYAFFYAPELPASTAMHAKVVILDSKGAQIGEPISFDFKLWRNFRVRTYTHALPCPEKMGMYQVVAYVNTAADPENVVEFRRPFGVTKLTGHAVPYEKNQFRFGAQMHFREFQPNVWQLEAKALQQIGVRFIRTGCGIGVLMPDEGQFDFAFMDSRVDYLKTLGINPLVILSGCDDQWAHVEKHDPKMKYYHGLMIKPDVWEKYCDAFFEHFRGRIMSAEVWNEPDLPYFARYTAEDYSTLAHIARKSRDKYAPEMQLMSAGFCCFNNSKGHFQEDALKLCKGVFDIHCFHGHGDFGGYRGTIQNSLFSMRERLNLTIPWYPHETALSSTGRTEQHQAEALWKKIIFSWSENAIGYTWYDHRNDGFDLNNPEHNYGLMTKDFYPKAAYIAYNTLIGLFNGNTAFVKTFEDDAFIYEFKRDKDILICGWVHDTGTPGVRNFATDAQTAEIVDMYGNVTPQTIANGRASIDISRCPCVLRLKNATRCTMAIGMVTCKQSKLVFKGQPVTVDLTLRNPTNRALAVELTITCPTGVTVDKKAETIRLNPNASVTKQVTFTGDLNQITSSSAVTISVGTKGDTPDYVRLPVRCSRILKDTIMGNPTFVLDRRDQMVELFDANPGEVHRLRKDTKDLSAKVWVAGNTKDLRIRVSVTDDIHSQANTGSDIWKGDSIQVFVKIPKKNQVWQFGCALHNDGKLQKAQWNNDDAFLQSMNCTISRKGTVTTYDVSIPWSAFSVTADELKKHGFQFNILVNESDSDKRESWIMAAPGVGNGLDASIFPSFQVK